MSVGASMVPAWRSRWRGSGARSAGGRPQSGLAGAASARRGGRSRRLPRPASCGRGSGPPGTVAHRAAPL